MKANFKQLEKALRRLVKASQNAIIHADNAGDTFDEEKNRDYPVWAKLRNAIETGSKALQELDETKG